MTPGQEPLDRANIESMLDANAAALGLTLDAEYRPGVLMNLERIAIQARTLMEFELADELELAPVFSHDGP